MSEAYTPQPVGPSDFNPDDVVRGSVDDQPDDSPDDTPDTPQINEQSDRPEQSRRRGKLAKKALGVIARRRELALNAKIDRATAPERDLDDLITDDQEILGHSGTLGKDMREGTRDVMNTVDKMYVSARNLNPASKLRDSYLTFRRDRLTRKVEELEQKVSTGPDTFLNRRQKARLEMLKNRREWKNRLLEKRDKKYTARAEKLGVRAGKRSEKFQQQVDKYIAGKIEAMRRKEQRKLLKEHGFGRTSRALSPVERARFLANLPPDTKKRLTREAILAVREQNIKKGKLDWLYEVDETKDTREVGSYGRTVG